jgi:DNA invertase Pin-like site-specific DNA recombinase
VDLVRAYSNLSDQAEHLRSLLELHLRSLLELPRAARPERRQRPPKQDQKRLAPDEVAQLIAAHRAGTGVKKLAFQFGIHRDTVHNILSRQGALRRRGIHPPTFLR